MKRKHDCKAQLCDTPHPKEHRPWNDVAAEYVKGRTAWDKLFCEHGFKRAKGTSWDCSQCVEKEMPWKK